MDYAVRLDPGSLTDIAPEWALLWEADPSSTLFHRPEFALAWIPVSSPAARPVLIEVRDGDDLAGLLTIAVDHDGVLRFLLDPEVTDYLGPISRPEMREVVAESAFEAAATIPGWIEAEFEALDADSGWVEVLSRAAKAAGFEVQEEPMDVSPRVRLGGGFEAYLAGLNGKLRHEIRRKARRLEREHEYSIRLSDAATLDADLEAFFRMHRASDGPKGHFMHEGSAGLFTRIASDFLRGGWLRLVWLESAGAPLAAVFGFSARGTWSVYNSAYDHRHRDLSPGMVVMGEAIRLAAEEGCHTFDLLRGSEPYKYRFGATDVSVRRLRARRT